MYSYGLHNVKAFGGAAANDFLDQVTDAQAAFSLRKLRAAYSGSAIRVRRSSDNVEQDIGFASGDLDTSSLSTFIGANSGYVTAWYDQSGNGFNATNPSAVQQPKIVNAGTLITSGGKAAIEFAPSTTNSSIRLFVYKVVAGATLTNAVADIAAPRLWYSLANGASSEIGYNNVAATVGNAGANAPDGLTIGNIRGLLAANYAWVGTIQEVILYPSNKSADRTTANGLMNTYYGIY